MAGKEKWKRGEKNWEKEGKTGERAENPRGPLSIIAHSLSILLSIRSPYVRSPFGCATACFAYKNKDGVLPNAFTYCDSPDGCGTGCQQFSRGNAAWDGSARDQQYFGPWGKGCSEKNPDAYAYQLCSCKKVDLANPATNDEPGWVSGPTVEEPRFV